jgi:signal transduction histidine kinase
VSSALGRDGKVEVTVRDSGPGLPAEDPEQLFQPFFSTKANGMGLGLAICRSIVEAHGGELRAWPDTAGGAAFQFSLNVSRSEAAQ